MGEEKISLWLLDDDLDDADVLGMTILDEFPNVTYRHFLQPDKLFSALANERPHFLLLERLMPREGIECLKRIRAVDNKLSLITYTAFSRKEAIMECYRNGTNLYIIKPLLFTSLKRTVELIVSRIWESVPATDYYVSEGEMVLLETPPSAAITI